MKSKIETVYYYISDILNLNKSDVILAAFPKTGSTWVRFLFCNLIALLEWNNRSVDFNLLNDTMPYFGEGNLHKKWHRY